MLMRPNLIVIKIIFAPSSFITVIKILTKISVKFKGRGYLLNFHEKLLLGFFSFTFSEKKEWRAFLLPVRS